MPKLLLRLFKRIPAPHRALRALVHRPLIWLLPFYIMGITWVWYVPQLRPVPFLIVASSLCLLAGFLLFKCSDLIQKYSVILLAPALVALGVGLCGLVFIPPAQQGHLLHNLSPGPVILGGFVHPESGWRPGQNFRLILDTREIIYPGDMGPRDSRQVFGLARLSVRGRLEVETGDYLRMLVGLGPLSGLRNPGTYDFQQYWATRGIWVDGHVKSPLLVSSWPEASERWFLSQWRGKAVSFIEEQVPQPAAGLMSSMLVGRRGAVDQPSNEIFRALGLSHLLAVSGLHLGLWYGLCFWVIRQILKYCSFIAAQGVKLNLVTAGLALVPALGYALLVGPASPVVRAAVMIAAITLALLTWRRTDPWNILALAAWVLLLTEPQRLFTASFQLSFVATAAMLAVFTPRPGEKVLMEKYSPGFWSTPVNINLLRNLLYKLYCKLCCKIPSAIIAHNVPKRKPRYTFFQSALLAALAGGLGTAPLVVWHFGWLPLTGLFVNVIFTPVISFFVLLPGLLALAMLPLSYTLAAGIMTLAGTVLNGLLPVMDKVAELSGPGWLLPAPGILVFLGWYGAGWVWLRGTGSRKKRLLWVGIILAVGFLPGLLKEQGDKGVLRFTVLDVGQGSAIHLNLPDATQILVDGGGGFNFDPGEMIVTPYFLRQGISKLDVVAMTHPDRDHLKGLITVSRYFKPSEVWSSSWPPEITPLYKKFLETIPKGSRVDLNPLYNGRQFGGSRITLLWPRFYQGLWLKDALKDDWENHYGLVLQVQWQGVSFLITGDIGPNVEAALVERYGTTLKSAVLIAPHHGSNTGLTPEFLEAVSPEWVVFNAGRRNSYGLPHPEAIARAKATGASIWRTDQDGAVIFEMQEEDGGLSPFTVRGSRQERAWTR